MMAINDFRVGELEDAFSWFGLPVDRPVINKIYAAAHDAPEGFFNLPDTLKEPGGATSYYKKRKQFVDAYESFYTPLIAILKQHGY